MYKLEVENRAVKNYLQFLSIKKKRLFSSTIFFKTKEKKSYQVTIVFYVRKLKYGP